MAGESRPGFSFPLGPIVATIVAIMAWSIFILSYALFWSKDYNWFQDVIVTIVSLLIVGLLIGLMWVLWGARHGWRAGSRMGWNSNLKYERAE